MPATQALISPTQKRCCRFCGATGNLTNEHWLPRWIHPLLAEGPSAPYVLEDEKDGIQRVWEAPLGSMTVKRVCRACNTGWMSELEERVKPVLGPMVEGKVRTLNLDERAVLATWVAKTALAFDLTRADPVVPDECRHWVRDHQTPPPGTIVLLARYGGRRFPLYGSHGTRKVTLHHGDERGMEWRTFLAAVSAGPVVGQLFGHGIENAVDLKPTNWKADFAHVLWPEPSPLCWPLPRALGDDGLRRFANEV